MSIKITSGASLDQMLDAIEQANRALDHNMEPNIKHDWAWLMASMVSCRKAAIQKNEKRKELKNGQI